MVWGWILGHRGKQTVPFRGAPDGAGWALSPRREGRELKAWGCGFGDGQRQLPPAPRLLPKVEIQFLSMGAGSRAECSGRRGCPGCWAPFEIAAQDTAVWGVSPASVLRPGGVRKGTQNQPLGAAATGPGTQGLPGGGVLGPLGRGRRAVGAALRAPASLAGRGHGLGAGSSRSPLPPPPPPPGISPLLAARRD